MRVAYVIEGETSTRLVATEISVSIGIWPFLGEIWYTNIKYSLLSGDDYMRLDLTLTITNRIENRFLSTKNQSFLRL